MSIHYIAYIQFPYRLQRKKKRVLRKGILFFYHLHLIPKPLSHIPHASCYLYIHSTILWVPSGQFRGIL